MTMSKDKTTHTLNEAFQNGLSPKTRNGPKASSFVFFAREIYNAYGKAQEEPITIDIKNRLYGNIEPIVGMLLIYLLIFLDLGLWKGIYKSFLYGVFAFVLMVVVKVLGDATLSN